MTQAWLKTLVTVLGLALVPLAGRADDPTMGAEKSSAEENDKEQKAKGGKDEKEEKGEKDKDDKDKEKEQSDLRLVDFFTTGWNEKFEERERAGRAARDVLFHTREGFLERELTLNYGYEYRADQARFDATEASVGIEYAFNRRFEIDVEPLYSWKQGRGSAASQNGSRWDLGTRFQLIDTADAAFNFQLHVLTPLSQVDEPQTTIGTVFAGFDDLTNSGLYRTGLYYDIEYDALIGPRTAAPDAGGLPATRRASSLLSYAVALNKTLGESHTPVIGEVSLFLEAFGVTDLNGTRGGSTFLALTPGFRTNVTGREEKAWWFQAGVDVPLTGSRGYDLGVRVSLIHDF